MRCVAAAASSAAQPSGSADKHSAWPEFSGGAPRGVDQRWGEPGGVATDAIRQGKPNLARGELIKTPSAASGRTISARARGIGGIGGGKRKRAHEDIVIRIRVSATLPLRLDLNSSIDTWGNCHFLAMPGQRFRRMFRIVSATSPGLD